MGLLHAVIFCKGGALLNLKNIEFVLNCDTKSNLKIFDCTLFAIVKIGEVSPKSGRRFTKKWEMKEMNRA